jgi:energy-coupling factor transporter ATP-binding protein EcfA2
MSGDSLVAQVRDRLLEDQSLDSRTVDLVLSALGERLTSVDNRVDATSSAPALAFLRSVSVLGFRGIGARAELTLTPGPGLTLVVGRNGSGKSSLAEAAEFALTGDSLRWAGRSKEWSEGWRNLHADGPSAIEVELSIDGSAEDVRVNVDWAADRLESALTSVSVGERRSSRDSLGWTEAVKTFRPFLSYVELSQMIEGRPIDRYNALAPMLGMESLVEPLEKLRQDRLSAERAIKSSESLAHDALTELRASSDSRAIDAVAALEGAWNLDVVRELVAGERDLDEASERLLAELCALSAPESGRVASAASAIRLAVAEADLARGSDAGRALRVAEMLEAAVDVHWQYGDDDCMVCGREGGMDPGRIAEIQIMIRGLHDEARDAQRSDRQLEDARAEASDTVGTAPRVLDGSPDDELGIDLSAVRVAWAKWLDAPTDPLALADHLERHAPAVQDAAAKTRLAAVEQRIRLSDSWRPLQILLAQLIEPLSNGNEAKQGLKQLRSAEKWLKFVEADIRAARFEEVKVGVLNVWSMLAVGSNVALEDVSLGTKRVNMAVSVDGDDGAALGVMSQGELHALALSLFIPRVTFGETPFGFAILDDPVQAMDPVRVDGLARVLRALAAVRQVVVFTHDDRLPATIRRLRIPARVIEVSRRRQSEVIIRDADDPASALLADARAIACGSDVPDAIARRVVPTFCRQAIEAAASHSALTKLVARGQTPNAVEDGLIESDRLLPRLALALFGDRDRAGDVYSELDQEIGGWAVDLVRLADGLSHDGVGSEVDLMGLVGRSESLIERMDEW